MTDEHEGTAFQGKRLESFRDNKTSAIRVRGRRVKTLRRKIMGHLWLGACQNCNGGNLRRIAARFEGGTYVQFRQCMRCGAKDRTPKACTTCGTVPHICKGCLIEYCDCTTKSSTKGKDGITYCSQTCANAGVYGGNAPDPDAKSPRSKPARRGSR